VKPAADNQKPRAGTGSRKPVTKDQRPTQGLRRACFSAIMKMYLPFNMRRDHANSHLPACWLHCLVCPRRYLAVLPSQARPNLFGSD